MFGEEVYIVVTELTNQARNVMSQDTNQGESYEGISYTGSFSEALASAVEKAVSGSPGGGFNTSWKLESVSGEVGSVVGNDVITVTIEASYGVLADSSK